MSSTPLYPLGPQEIFQSLWRHRSVVWQLTRREVLGRYRGSVLGLCWSLFHPLFMLAVYTFFFGFVFKVRWEGMPQAAGHLDFAVILFVGLMVHSFFAECLNRAPMLVLGNPNYVKKLIFPLEVLPWVSLGSAFFHFLVSLAVLLAFMLAGGQSIPWTILLLPLLMAPFLLLTAGTSWMLASLGVYLRDIWQGMGLLSSCLLFLSPVFYPLKVLPEAVRPWLYLNPLTFVVEELRELIIVGQLPDWRGLAIYGVLSGLAAWVGWVWFQRTRKGFADVV